MFGIWGKGWVSLLKWTKVRHTHCPGKGQHFGASSDLRCRAPWEITDTLEEDFSILPALPGPQGPEDQDRQPGCHDRVNHASRSIREAQSGMFSSFADRETSVYPTMLTCEKCIPTGHLWTRLEGYSVRPSLTKVKSSSYESPKESLPPQAPSQPCSSTPCAFDTRASLSSFSGALNTESQTKDHSFSCQWEEESQTRKQPTSAPSNDRACGNNDSVCLHTRAPGTSPHHPPHPPTRTKYKHKRGGRIKETARNQVWTDLQPWKRLGREACLRCPFWERRTKDDPPPRVTGAAQFLWAITSCFRRWWICKKL